MWWVALTSVGVCLCVISLALLLTALLTPNWFLMQYGTPRVSIGVILSCFDFGPRLPQRRDCVWTRSLQSELLGPGKGADEVQYALQDCPWEGALAVANTSAALCAVALSTGFCAIICALSGQWVRRRSALLGGGAVSLAGTLLAIICAVVYGAAFNRSYSCSGYRFCDTTLPIVPGGPAVPSTCRLDWSWYLVLSSIFVLFLGAVVLCLSPVRTPARYVVMPPLSLSSLTRGATDEGMPGLYARHAAQSSLAQVRSLAQTARGLSLQAARELNPFVGRPAA